VHVADHHIMPAERDCSRRSQFRAARNPPGAASASHYHAAISLPAKTVYRNCFRITPAGPKQQAPPLVKTSFSCNSNTRSCMAPTVTFAALGPGLCVGALLNMCTYRGPRDLSIISTPSFRPDCRAGLSWRNKLPGCALLHGLCRLCGSRISLRCPIVEVAAGIFYLLGVQHFGFGLGTLKAALLGPLQFSPVFAGLEQSILPLFSKPAVRSAADKPRTLDKSRPFRKDVSSEKEQGANRKAKPGEFPVRPCSDDQALGSYRVKIHGRES